ncbi:MAG: hybrid sensor histidine kinase/response regulator, partial [Bacteroidales bacterium]|nr:hybrid sensor histidine kinase/response regulator [Bacteroidales bacterium]
SLLDQILPDLILLDVMMPEINGFEVCRMIKKKETLRSIPIIFLTAKIQTEDLAEGFNAGGVDYITKPYNSEELKIRIRNHIELALSRKKIFELNKNRDKLYSIIAHDIRAPFSGISMTISAISSGYLDPAGPEFKEIITHLEKTTNETSRLLDNLLEWTKLNSDSEHFLVRQQKIKPIIDDCVSLFEDQSSKKNIAISTHIPENNSACFDENTIRSVFRNLIFNAIKFTPEGGKIDVISHIHSNYLFVSVKDNGIGISEDVLGKIFKNNEHYSSRGTNKEEGSGLGSFLIRDFIEKNMGKLEVKSTSGEGTEVQVFLPLKKLL